MSTLSIHPLGTSTINDAVSAMPTLPVTVASITVYTEEYVASAGMPTIAGVNAGSTPMLTGNVYNSHPKVPMGTLLVETTGTTVLHLAVVVAPSAATVRAAPGKKFALEPLLTDGSGTE